LRRHYDNLRTLNQSQRQSSSATPGAQHCTFFLGQHDGRGYSHAA
jgi:hypothetical protein